MTDYVYKVEIPKSVNMSAADVMPADCAAERAKRDPQPGDQWTEMFSYWIYVCARDGDEVLAREYAAPCDITPEAAKKTYRCAVSEFPDHVKFMTYNGNKRWVAEAGGVLDKQIDAGVV